jgi:hypothetical protein
MASSSGEAARSAAIQRVERDLQHQCTAFRRAAPGLAHSFEMAELYRLGLYPFVNPDNDLSVALFNQMLALPLRPMMRNMIKDNMQSLISLSDIAEQAMQIPKQPGNSVLNMFKTCQQQYMEALTPRPRQPAPQQQQAVVNNEHGGMFRQQQQAVVNNEHGNMFRQQHGQAAAENLLVFQQHLRQRADAQNVHDHSTVSSTRIAISALMSEYSNAARRAQTTSAWRLVYRFLGHRVLWKHVHKIYAVLSSLTTAVNCYSCSEQDLLCAVLWKIDRQDAAATRRALLESLGLVLSTAMEHGLPVCHTGKMTRMISVVQYLQLTDAGVAPDKLKHLDTVLRTEVLQLASTIRTAWRDKQDDDTKKKLDDGDAELAALLRAEFVEQMRTVYKELAAEAVLKAIEEESVDYF